MHLKIIHQLEVLRFKVGVSSSNVIGVTPRQKLRIILIHVPCIIHYFLLFFLLALQPIVGLYFAAPWRGYSLLA